MVAGCGIRMCGNVCGTPHPRGEGGYNKSCHTLPHSHTPYFSGVFAIFGEKQQKKKMRPKNGPQLAPLWSKLPQNCPKIAQKNRGGGPGNPNKIWCSTGLCFFDQTFQNLRPLSDSYKKMQHLLFCPFWRCSPFFVFALIRGTLGFEFFGPNTSYTLIRATFRGF